MLLARTAVAVETENGQYRLRVLEGAHVLEDGRVIWASWAGQVDDVDDEIGR